MNIGDFQKAINKEVKATKKVISRERKATKKTIEKEQKATKKAIENSIKLRIKKEGRVRIDAKRRKQVLDKYNYRCAVCKKSLKTLQIHHKNGKNSDNSLKNLELLCPNHHYEKHAKGSKLNKTIRERSLRKRNPFGLGI